ncbi:unnamed protein product [Parnassius mnemosyne]|uniref:Transposase n=1 Tax=Parnassius mnemosyne TaxID=213953 RepID=A0AAV1LLF0_9NEOP
MKIDPEKLQSVNFCRSRELAAAICDVSVRAVDKIKKECIKGEVSSPRQSVYRPCTVTALDDFDKSVIKQIVSSFYRDSEYPFTAKILSTAKERIDGFQCSISSMRKILSSILRIHLGTRTHKLQMVVNN